MPRVAKQFVITESDRSELEAIIRAHTSEQRHVIRSKIILGCADGTPIDQLASELNVSRCSVHKWRNRYESDGISGLYDKPRSGRKAIYGDDLRNAILKKLGETPPDGLARWDGRVLARELNTSPHAVWRILKKEGIQLARMRSWCVSTDPEFTQKAADIVGLYLNPPENAIVLSIDEKPSIQALTRPVGYIQCQDKSIVRAYKSTYKRNGTINLFAALDVAKGHVYGKVTKTKNRADFLDFMDELLRDLPAQEGVEYHVILDNYCTHKRCDAWLKDHPNVVFHYTPTSASWLNMIEIWFGIMSRKVLRGASFDSKDALAGNIKKFIEAYNKNDPHPFVWRKREVKGAQIKDTLANLCN